MLLVLLSLLICLSPALADAVPVGAERGYSKTATFHLLLIKNNGYGEVLLEIPKAEA